MTLHMPLMVNGREIGHALMVRENAVVNPGEPSEYYVEIQCGHDFAWIGQVRHVREDGAAALIAAAFAAAVAGAGADDD